MGVHQMVEITLEETISVAGGKQGNVSLMTHSTHFLILRLYGLRHMVKDHLDGERRNLPLSQHGISSMGYFIYIPAHKQGST